MNEDYEWNYRNIQRRKYARWIYPRKVQKSYSLSLRSTERGSKRTRDELRPRPTLRQNQRQDEARPRKSERKLKAYRSTLEEIPRPSTPQFVSNNKICQSPIYVF